jgi:aryl-alcohol dehydrogenase-like predicted oxidoreductase
MKKRRLGKTNLMVSEIGFGCRSIGGKKINEHDTVFSNISKENAEKLLKFAIESGINVFDTSDSYSSGRSEIRLGEAIHGHRSDVYVFTKAGTEFLNNSKSSSRTNLSFDYLLSSLKKSLERLDTDYVDLFQTHGIPQNQKDIEEIVKTFEKMKSENMARYCGISIGNAISKGLELIDYNFVDCLQLSFSLINTEALKELIPKCHKKNIGIIVNRPLAEGFLGDFNMKKNFSQDDFRSNYSKEKIISIQNKLDSLQFLKDLYLPLNKIAIAYILNNPMISTCIPSSNSIKQLSLSIAASDIKLDPKIIKQING